MRIPGRKALRLPAAWLKSRFADSAIILGYHRVADPVVDPFSMCVSSDRFAEQLEAVCAVAKPIDLRALSSCLRMGDVPPKSVALTFDDGYADVLHAAMPLLETYDVPATVFVTTGYMSEEFWWDSLERILLRPPRLPDGLGANLERVDGANRGGFSLPPPTLPESKHQRDTLQGSRARALQRSEQRRVFLEVYRWLRRLSDSERRTALGGLARSASDSKIFSRNGEDCRALNPSEVRQLSENGLISLGAHTVTHPLLVELPEELQRMEIEQSKADLESRIQDKIVAFSYPHGSISKRLRTIVRETGYEFACSSRSDVVWGGSDLFALPRFWPGNWGGKRFSRWLSTWIGA